MTVPRMNNPAEPIIVRPASMHEINLRHMPALAPVNVAPCASNTPLDTQSNAPVPTERPPGDLHLLRS
jgi:hypothetical protein